MWTIILRYQIQVSEGSSARIELINWVRSKIPEYNINNFGSDWASGKALCALTESVLPGQMDLPSEFTNDPVRDAQMGISRAKENMNIPPLIDAQDFVSTPDELSNMTYLCFFRDFLDLENRRREQQLFDNASPAKCIVYGPGVIAQGNSTGVPLQFTIEARNAADRRCTRGGEVFTVQVISPNENVGAQMTDNGDGTYLVVFEAPKHDAGDYTIEIKLNNHHLKDSPFLIRLTENIYFS